MATGFSRKDNLTKETLLALARAGCFVVAATSPYFLTNFLQAYFKDKMKRACRKRAERLRELEKKRVVSFQELPDGKVKIELTQHGQNRIRCYQLEDLKINIPKKWDRKWRLIFYDIPEYNKKARDALSKKLRDLGLYQFQKSLWVSAYNCLPEIEFCCAVFNIDMNNHIFYLETQNVPKEKEIKKWFHLV